MQTSGVPVSTVRSKFSQTIATGIDEVQHKDLSLARMREQWQNASAAAGSRRRYAIAEPMKPGSHRSTQQFTELAQRLQRRIA
jgi:hypothetical protein